MERFDVDLSDVVALVTGASRGAGRGIALVLGAAGATVYVTGRSVRGEPSGPDRQGTIEDTADAVTARGGRGIAVRCDHTVEDDVIALCEKIGVDHGALDVLVNNAWGGYEQREPGVDFFGVPFWRQPMWRWEGMFTAGVRAHFLTSRYAAPLLIEDRAGRPGLVVSTIAWAFDAYLGNVLYDTAKAATARMAFGMARDLRDHRVAAVAIAPGHVGVTETPEYVGRAIATLAADPELMRRTGSLLTAGDLARDYGFTDLDGTQPEPFRLSED